MAPPANLIHQFSLFLNGWITKRDTPTTFTAKRLRNLISDFLKAFAKALANAFVYTSILPFQLNCQSPTTNAWKMTACVSIGTGVPPLSLSSYTPSSPCRTGVSDPGGTLAEPKKSPNDQSTFVFENERELRKKKKKIICPSRDWNPGPPVLQAGALPLDHGGTDMKL